MSDESGERADRDGNARSGESNGETETTGTNGNENGNGNGNENDTSGTDDEPPIRNERDDRGDRNVYGTELQPCSTDPMTGYLRDGCCRRVESDRGRHEICAVMTAEFLEFSRAQGNDLVSSKPEFDFPGLEPGDRWCLCLGRWIEAEEAGCAPPVVLEATHEAVLRDVEPDLLREYEYEPGDNDELE